MNVLVIVIIYTYESGDGSRGSSTCLKTLCREFTRKWLRQCLGKVFRNWVNVRMYKAIDGLGNSFISYNEWFI